MNMLLVYRSTEGGIMNTKEMAAERVEDKMKELRRAMECEQMVARLPQGIQDMEAAIYPSYGGMCRLTATGDAAFETLFDNGVVFDSEYLFDGSYGTDMENSTDFRAMGTLKVDDLVVRVSVSSLPKPETCEIEAVEETTVRYVAKCKDTSEEL